MGLQPRRPAVVREPGAVVDVRPREEALRKVRIDARAQGLYAVLSHSVTVAGLLRKGWCL